MAFVTALNLTIRSHKQAISLLRPTNFITTVPFRNLTQLPSRVFVPTSASTLRMSSTYTRADLDHLALDCSGSSVALTNFYSSVLGFEPINVEEYKQGKAHFPSVRVNPTTIIDFFENKELEQTPGIHHGNHFCFALPKPEFDALLIRLKEADVSTKGPPKLRSGARGHGWSVYIDDPEGNTIEFRYYE